MYIYQTTRRHIPDSSLTAVSTVRTSDRSDPIWCLMTTCSDITIVRIKYLWWKQNFLSSFTAFDFPKPVFLNHRAVTRYWALASIIPGPSLIKKNLPGRGLTKVENHCPKHKYSIYVIVHNVQCISVRRCCIDVNEMFIFYRHWWETFSW
jgi:hypothetical protein